jgi:hypothetical protein
MGPYSEKSVYENTKKNLNCQKEGLGFPLKIISTYDGIIGRKYRKQSEFRFQFRRSESQFRKAI